MRPQVEWAKAEPRCLFPPRPPAKTASAVARAREKWRVLSWSFLWGLSFVAAALVIKREWLPYGVTLAAVMSTGLLGLATVLAHRRFLAETDELRRKIEVEALSLAFGVGVVGGLTFWLLAVMDAVSVEDFIYVFVVMILAHPLGVLIGRRRYS